jgi:hypothetical protein
MKINHPVSFGTVSERIGDESLTPRCTLFVPYNILWPGGFAQQHAESPGSAFSLPRAAAGIRPDLRQTLPVLMVNGL